MSASLCKTNKTLAGRVELLFPPNDGDNNARLRVRVGAMIINLAEIASAQRREDI